MKTETALQLLALYKGRETDPEKSRVSFPTFWDDKEWCSATECHHFILIPSEQSFKLPDPGFITYDIGKIMPVLHDGFEIKVANLQKAVASIGLVDEEITDSCDDCDGSGTFRYGRYDYECKRCDGNGEEGTGEYQKVKDPDALIQIGTSVFSDFFIAPLLEACKLTRTTILRCRSQNVARLSVFELKHGILVGIMPRIDHKPDKVIICK